MSTNVNIGNQSITFQYYQEAKARSFNELLYKVVPQGILDGGEISIINDSTVSLDKFNLMLEVATDTNDIAIKISTRESVQLLSTEENCYIVGEYEWLDFKDNYMDIKCIRKSAITSKHVIFGKIEYLNGVPHSVDYTERTLSKLYNATHSNYSNFLVTTHDLSKDVIVKKGKVFIGGNEVSTSGDYIIKVFEEVNYGMVVKVYIGQDGIPDCVRGEDSEEYIEPNIPNNTILLAIIRIPPNASVILGDYITQVTDFDVNTSMVNIDDELNEDSDNPLQNSVITEKFELIDSYMQSDKSPTNQLTTKSYVDDEIETNITSKMGQNNGIATLDENGRIPYSQLPESAIEFKGSWDASTNTPTLSDGTGTKGDMYIVSVEGSQDLGSGEILFLVNDRIIYDGSVWEKLSGGNIRSVNNKLPQNGNIEIYSDDVKISENDETKISEKLEQIRKEYINLVGSRMLGRNWNVTDSHVGYSDIIYGNGVWVAGCILGIKYSTDGINWHFVNVNFPVNCKFKFIYENNMFVGLYEDTYNVIRTIYSNDGIDWLLKEGDVMAELRGNIFINDINIVYKNNKWIITCDNGELSWYSENGHIWNQMNISIKQCDYDNNNWIGIKYNGDLIASNDGFDWNVLLTDYKYDRIIYRNGIWIIGAGSYIFWSNDVGILHRIDSINSISKITYGNGIFIIIDVNDKIYYSKDGMEWYTNNFTAVYSIGISYSNGIFYCVKRIDVQFKLYHSVDGKSWFETNIPFGLFNFISCANDTWIMLSNDHILYSTDGINWIESNKPSIRVYDKVVYANGVWNAISANDRMIHSSVQDLIDNGWLKI